MPMLRITAAPPDLSLPHGVLDPLKGIEIPLSVVKELPLPNPLAARLRSFEIPLGNIAQALRAAGKTSEAAFWESISYGSACLVLETEGMCELVE